MFYYDSVDLGGKIYAGKFPLRLQKMDLILLSLSHLSFFHPPPISLLSLFSSSVPPILPIPLLLLLLSSLPLTNLTCSSSCQPPTQIVLHLHPRLLTAGHAAPPEERRGGWDIH